MCEAFCHGITLIRDEPFCFAIEEGEAWFLGDLQAIKTAFPKAKNAVLSAYVNDSICGTWEYLADAVFPGGSKALSAQGWQKIGAEKSEWAKKISPNMEITVNKSPSFQYFCEKIFELIQDASKSSEEVLMGLAEKIGNTMQKTVFDMGEQVQQGMKQSMQEVMGPGIERLVGASEELATKQADGSQQFLQELIGKFTEGLGAEGKRQQELMASTSGEVKEAMSAWGEDMNTFLARLETQFSAIEEESRKRNILVEEQLRNNSDSQRKNAEKSTTQLNEIMTRYATDLEQKHENMTQTDVMRQKAFEEQVGKLNENQTTMMTSMEELIGKHTDASKSVIAQGVSLGKGVMDIQTSLKTVSTQMESAGENLHQAAMALQKTTDSVNQSNAALTGAILEATQSNTSLSNQNKEVASKVKELLTSIISLKKDYEHTTDLLKQAAQNAELTFTQLNSHQESYRLSLKNHIDETMTQVDKLMKNYGEQMDAALTGYAEQLNDALATYGKHVEGQTHARMQAWDKETQNYTSAMLGVVQAMEALVDDMEVINAR